MAEVSFGEWLKRNALDLTREALVDRVGYFAETIPKVETDQQSA